MTPSDKLEMLSDEGKVEIIDHMNSDHADAVLTYVHLFGNRGDGPVGESYVCHLGKDAYPYDL